MSSPDESVRPAPGSIDASPLPPANGTTTAAATIGVRVEEPATGWWAITDAGARAFVPEQSVQGYRTLRPGQRIALTWRETPGGPEVVAAAPPTHW